MKIDIFDIKEFIDVNHLEEVTSPVFDRGGYPHPEGLISNEIFGMTTKARKETFAYIDLGGYFFHPHIFKAIHRIFANIDKIVSGELYYIIEDGKLILDNENGETGIEFLYNNWDRIKWEKTEGYGMRNERIDILTGYPKNIIFTKYQLVIPAFYRDIRTKQSGGTEQDDINKYYSRLIRLSSTIKQQSMFDFQFHNTNYSIQSTMVDIYEYFRDKLKGKNGIIRKYLMGKSVDYCSRTVITAETFNSNKPEDNMISYEYSAVPISQACSMASPFVIKWVKEFFERTIFDHKDSLVLYDEKEDKVFSTRVLDPESYFNDRFVNKMIDTFIKDPESRFTKLSVPLENGKTAYLQFTGTRYSASNTAELAGIRTRPMCWTDLLFLATSEVTKEKHLLSTRYPVLHEYGTFITKIRISSTIKTEPMLINGELYKNYPVVDYSVPHHRVGSLFIDSFRFANSYLEGINGDYDGDQVTCKIIFTQEGNEECENYIYHKSNFISASGGNIRVIGKEAFQTFYVLTKDPTKEHSNALSKEDTDFFINIDPEKIDFNMLVDWFGNTVDSTTSKENKFTWSKYNPTDTLTIKAGQYFSIKEDTKTTLGRLVFNKLMVEKLGFTGIVDYVNDVLVAGRFKAFERTVTEALKNDKISTKQFIKYIDTRDWFGLQMHGVITTSFTLNVIKTPAEVKELKKKLLSENKEKLQSKENSVVSSTLEDIQNQLINKSMDILKNDVGLDLYKSGARGSVSNHYKNINIMRGAVYNSATDSYDVITNSLLDGLDKKDMSAHVNALVAGAYAKGVGTQVGGYISKQLIAAMQSEVISPDPDSDCGTKGYTTVTLTKWNSKLFIDRWIIEGDKLKLLTYENIDKYVGKKVKMRSFMYCIGVGGNQHCMCAKCAGMEFYKLNKTKIGLLTPVASGNLSQMSLQKFHDNQVRTTTIDVDTILI